MHSTGQCENSKWFCRWNKTSSLSRLACLCLKFCGVVLQKTVVFATRDWWASKHIEFHPEEIMMKKVEQTYGTWPASSSLHKFSKACPLPAQCLEKWMSSNSARNVGNMLQPFATNLFHSPGDGWSTFPQSKCHPNPWHHAVKLLRLVGHPFSMRHRGIHARCTMS